MLKFKFNALKTTQAAAILLELLNGSMTRMRLLKHLYITDRELLVETGRILTGDRVVAMNYGPVLSHTYNLMKGELESPQDWNKFILSKGRDLVLVGSPGRNQLTKREVHKLEAIFDRYKYVKTLGLSAKTHGFPEYIKHFVPDSSRHIPWEDALSGAGRQDLIATYINRNKEQQIIDSIFGRMTNEGG